MFYCPLLAKIGSAHSNVLLQIVSTRGQCRAYDNKNSERKEDGSQEAASTNSSIKGEKRPDLNADSALHRISFKHPVRRKHVEEHDVRPL